MPVLPPLLYISLSSLSFVPSSIQPQGGKWETTALWKAAYYGHAEVVKLLITDGKAAVDKAQNSGATPLFTAAQEGNTEVVKLLLKGGADVNIARQGQTPLSQAKENGHQAIVALLEPTQDVSSGDDY